MPPDTAVEAVESWRRLRALAVGDRAGWFAYVAGELGGGRHLVRVDDRFRELQRDEVTGWVEGVAAARSRSSVLDDLGDVPPLTTIDQAARTLHITTDGVDYRIGAGKLYPLYLARARGGRERHLFASQVNAAVFVRGAREQWQRTRALLPPTTRIVDLPDYAGPAPSPDPLPLPSGPAESTRRIKALLIGDAEGWFEYVAGDPAADRYLARVTEDGTRREVTLTGGKVLPWVLGHADAYGHPELVAYREGLG